ncbi:MAG: hypothetical protein ABF966_09805 [Bifidobacterium psychraerophilum]|uniref:hypothetical protein n=1 Tax=Bifidobacterium psychraerophilum TaxID=218140 RepID=UPI0039E80B52
MLSPTDAWDLMTAIKHLDHRSVTRDDAILFAQIVNDACAPTLKECLAAVAQWFGTHHDFGMIQPGDVADIVKRNRPAASLTENQINSLLIEQGLEGDALWAGGAPAEVRRLVNQGMPLDDAAAQAATKWRGHELEAPERKPRKHIGHHFAGRMNRMNLNDVLGEEQ